MASNSSKNNQSAKVLLILLVLVLAGVVIYYYVNNHAQPPVPQANISALVVDLDDMLPQSTSCTGVIQHTAYYLCYNEQREQPDWVCYRLKAAQTHGSADRSENFRKDESVATGSALPEDYKKSGYDKGHLVPAGDMKWSDEAMSETFYMSNMSPQVPGFNRGIWKKLEEQVRDWAKEDSDIYIAAGPVFKSSTKEIGKNKVDVPDYYFKVVADVSMPEYKAIGFIFKNEGSEEPVYSYAVSIDSVERFTGIDFFPKLPDNVETSIESEIDLYKWFSNDTYHVANP